MGGFRTTFPMLLSAQVIKNSVMLITYISFNLFWGFETVKRDKLNYIMTMRADF